MYIKTQDKNTIVNTDLVSSIKLVNHVDGTATIAAWTCNGYLVELGRYPIENAGHAVELLFDAFIGNCRYYVM